MYVGLMWSRLFNQTPISECYIARLVVKNKHPTDTCHDANWSMCSKYNTILDSIVNKVVRSM